MKPGLTCRICPLILLFITLSGEASDGRLEINQTCAVNGGCFSGDTSGFPVTIVSSGSYLLTSNLVVADPDLDAIHVAATDGHVGIDLNLFAVAGPVSCTGSGSGISCDPGTGVGVRSVAGRLQIKNGQITGFGAGGVDAGVNGYLSELVAETNGGHGLNVGEGGIIRNSIALRNGINGISVGMGARIDESTSTGNGGSGFSLDSSSSIESSTALQNGGNGIAGNTDVLVSDTTTRNNSDHGVIIGSRGSVFGAKSRGNGGAGISAGLYGLVENSTAHDNGEQGIVAGFGGRVSGSISSENTLAGFDLGVGSKFRNNQSISNSVPDSCGNGECSERRRFLITPETYTSTEAPTLACPSGFSFASYFELADHGSLEYDNVLGLSTFADQGDGPPAPVVGWARTGTLPSTISSDWNADCDNWSSVMNTHYGNVLEFTGIDDSFDEISRNQINYLRTRPESCDTNWRVWCIEDI